MLAPDFILEAGEKYFENSFDGAWGTKVKSSMYITFRLNFWKS